MKTCFRTFSIVLPLLAVLAAPASCFALSGRDVLDEKETVAEGLTIKPMPTTGVGNVFPGDAGDVVDIRLVQMRPVGAGGVLPFRTSDVRNRINPQAILASTTTTTGGGGSGGGGSSPAVVTCADGTEHPSVGVVPNVTLILPTAGGACSLATGPSVSTEAVFQVTTFTSINATIAGLNGWTVNTSTLNVGMAGPASNAGIQVSKAGVTYSMTISALTNTAGSGKIIISSFIKL